MLGCEEHEVGNTPEEWFRRIHPEDGEQVRLRIDLQLTGSQNLFDSQHRMLHKDGSYRWMSCRGLIVRDEKGQAVRMTGSHSDITAEKVADSLTGLPNRVLFLDRLARSIERATRHNDFLFAVLLLDLDRFKSLVESMGSTAGDQLLTAVARRLETCLRSEDTVARLGRDHVLARLAGDEFAILLNGLGEVGDAKIVAERLLKEISTRFDLGARSVFASASVGIALSATGYSCPEEVLRDADTAMYRAKSLGRARCEVFDTAVFDTAQTRLQLEADLRAALERQEFLVHFQPIVDLKSRQIIGLEALVRWDHPARGMVPPQEFIPIAESTGLIIPLDRRVLREACRQLRDWQEGLGISEDVWVSVNLSTLQFMQPDLVEQIGEVLQETNLGPHCLMVELTESVVMENPEAVRSLLMQLRILGMQVALDDFGTGYSSLSYLRQLPADLLKIDRSFVRRSGPGLDGAEIIRAISGLAHQLGLRVVAEGIETDEQLDLMRSLDCEYGQGYLFSRAISSDQAAALLKEGSIHRDGVKPADENAAQNVPAVVACSHDPHLPISGDLRLEATPTRQRESRFRKRAVSASLVLAGLILILVAGVLEKSGRKVQQPSGLPSQPDLQGMIDPSSATGAVDRPLVAPARKANQKSGLDDAPSGPVLVVQESPRVKQTKGISAGSETVPPVNATSAKTATGASARPRPLTEDRARPASRTYAVVHDHVFGSCRGNLRVSRDTVTFASEKEKDSFSLKYHEFFCTLSKDSLVIKSASQAYRFKSATARNGDENQSQLQEIARRISGYQRGTASKER